MSDNILSELFIGVWVDYETYMKNERLALRSAVDQSSASHSRKKEIKMQIQTMLQEWTDEQIKSYWDQAGLWMVMDAQSNREVVRIIYDCLP